MTLPSIFRPLQILAGVQKVEDATAAVTPHWIDSIGVRFRLGLPEKIGGWELAFSGLVGVCRTIWSAVIAGLSQCIIGTNSTLYNLVNNEIVNITPLKTSSVSAANSLATHYATLANNPFSSVNLSNLVTVTDSEAQLLEEGDTVTISGATGFAGIPAGNLNATHVVYNIVGSTYQIQVSTPANANATGGGAAVVRSSGLITLTKALHGLLDGQRVKVSGAADTGGILAADINIEFIIRNVTANTFDFLTEGTASSSASSAGGASTVYFTQIDAGLINTSSTSGYGAGLYGAGLYGTALVSSTAVRYPRIWFCDVFGDLIVMTPGNQGGLYVWDGSTVAAPVQVGGGAPTAVNYCFTSDNILVTLGAEGVENRISTSDQASTGVNGYDNWTSSSTNSVYKDDIEGAGRWISHVNVNSQNLLFTNTQTWTFRKISLAAGIWQIKQISPAIGIIAPNARVAVNGVAYWMGQNNFYLWRGGQVEIIPSNNPSVQECTLRNTVFNNINRSQQWKCFAEYNPIFEEIEFHYPVGNEPDTIVRLSLKDYSWAYDELDRTAAEYPVMVQQNPRKADLGGNLYYHEIGNDAAGQPLQFSVTTRLLSGEKNQPFLSQVITDSYQSGNISVLIEGKLYPQSANLAINSTYTVTPTTEFIATTNMARYWQYTVSGNVLGQYWRAGAWQEAVQQGSNAK
jgi:hypothetical protein